MNPFELLFVLSFSLVLLSKIMTDLASLIETIAVISTKEGSIILQHKLLILKAAEDVETRLKKFHC